MVHFLKSLLNCWWFPNSKRIFWSLYINRFALTWKKKKKKKKKKRSVTNNHSSVLASIMVFLFYVISLSIKDFFHQKVTTNLEQTRLSFIFVLNHVFGHISMIIGTT